MRRVEYSRSNSLEGSSMQENLIFASGINIILCMACLIVDAVAVLEVKKFSSTWSTSAAVPLNITLPVQKSCAFLGIDGAILIIQLILGIRLQFAGYQRAISKLKTWFFHSIILFSGQFLNLVIYMITIGPSVYYNCFAGISMIFKLFLFFLVYRFIKEQYEEITFDHNGQAHIYSSWFG